MNRFSSGAIVRTGGSQPCIGGAPNVKYSALRKYCFEVMQALKLTHPENDPVYLYLVKKEQEGKHPKAAKMAAVNKFLRIYYARVMALDK